jgi:mannose-6-phosphate isomerase-like protein (cupin superfamily)
MTLKEDITEKVHVVEKPWGHEEWLSVTKRYVLKKLVLKKGARFSLQYHKKKEESLYLITGKIKLTLGKADKSGRLEVSVFKRGETLHLLPKTIHRAEALEESVIIEASTPHLLDVVRLSDDYRREGTSKP